nr:Transposon Ty3-G Gag-Pol polyprotein [Ipomoea batatas]
MTELSLEPPISLQSLQQLLDGMEQRLQTKLTEQLRAAMATNEAKWQTDKGIGHASTSEGRGLANPLSPPNELITTPEGWTDGVQHTSKLGSMRLDIRKFDGTDAQRWIFQIQEYFDYHQTPEPHSLQMASFCLEGDASEWYWWMKRNCIVHNWDVMDFQAKFEKLMNRVTGVSENQLVSYIIGGLKPHLKRELLMARPDTVAATFKLAKAHEARHAEIIAETRMANRGNPRLRTPLGEHRWQPRITSIPQAPSSAAPPQNITPALPIKKYIAAEIRERRDKGADDDDAKEADVQQVEPDSSGGEVVTSDISMLNTLAGLGNSFTLDLNVLPIAGPDIVLAIQWLQGLGRVAHDYSMNTMEFKNGTKKVVLTGETALQSSRFLLLNCRQW